MILMQQNSVDYNTLDISYLLGSSAQLASALSVSPKTPFDDEVIEFLDEVSHRLFKNPKARNYSDVVTFAFWVRKSSLLQMKRRFISDKKYRIGKGIVFHIAPSNVAVNFAYSLVSGLLCGNVNIVKVPSKDFEQVGMIVDAFRDALSSYSCFIPYINIIRFGHDRTINDALSAVCDVRVIWGGDNTIGQLRQSQIHARTTEVTFADRFSASYIEAVQYLAMQNKRQIASDFYNDTYLTDQNACTSPRIVFWKGSEREIDEAKEIFWNTLHELAASKYVFHDIYAVDKLCDLCLMAVHKGDAVREVPTEDNLIKRVKISRPDADYMRWKCHAGLFFEYDCRDVLELKDICNNLACQTLSYLGEKESLDRLLADGIKGVDRIVPIGKTMDFDLIWDGYNLVERFTRIVDIR